LTTACWPRSTFSSAAGSEVSACTVVTAAPSAGQRLGAAVDDGDLVVAAVGEQAGDGLADVAGSEQDEAHEDQCQNVEHGA
jgi:hypothetical protein